MRKYPDDIHRLFEMATAGKWSVASYDGKPLLVDERGIVIEMSAVNCMAIMVAMQEFREVLRKDNEEAKS